MGKNDHLFVDSEAYQSYVQFQVLLVFQGGGEDH